MQIAATSYPAAGTLSAQPPAAPSLVVFTDLDGTLRDPRSHSLDEARVALALLADRRVPVVLFSDAGASEVKALQRELGLQHPFICEGGAALWVPRHYFPELPRLGEPSGKRDVVRFQSPYNSGQAIRLLISLYRACCPGSVVVVGLGDDWADRDMLREVDVPVIVRNDTIDQARLIRKLPAAYVTKAAGPAGWSEAILGSVGEGT
jgi:predicted mannosyl-3-phosphoglycerate phosphatase (HAD superfamily)